jgi:hypothetical protein
MHMRVFLQTMAVALSSAITVAQEAGTGSDAAVQPVSSRTGATGLAGLRALSNAPEKHTSGWAHRGAHHG